MVVNRTSEYLKSLKSKASMSTKALSDLTNIPEDTINNILYGKTASPSFDAVAALVRAMGGSLDELAGIRTAGDDEGTQDMFAVYQQMVVRGIRQRNIIIMVLLAILVIVVAWLVWDITHPDVGLIRLKQLIGLMGKTM